MEIPERLGADQRGLDDRCIDVVLYGPPGSGKGTQAPRIAERLQRAHVCTGDILRSPRVADTELGRAALELIAAGQLVPDAVVADLVASRLQDQDTRRGVIWDGYPRTLGQAQHLVRELHDRGRAIGCVIVLDVGLPELLRRLAQRRVCPVCTRVYHLGWNAPVDKHACDCGATLTVRIDDTDVAIRKRHEVFTLNTAPILKYFVANAVPVTTVDGCLPANQVTTEILTRVGDAVAPDHPRS